MTMNLPCAIALNLDRVDDKIDVTKKSEFVLGRLQNIVGNGENGGNQRFLLFP